MKGEKVINPRPKSFKLAINNIYKVFDGKKYKLQGSAPIGMKPDLIRVYKKHGYKVQVEKIRNGKMNLWLRK